MMQQLIDDAYAKIVGLYRDKKQSFVIHLIKCYTNLDKKIVYTNSMGNPLSMCCITEKRYIPPKIMKDIGEKEKIMYAIEESEASCIHQTRLLYTSKKSNTLISLPAVIALERFVRDNIASEAKISRLFEKAGIVFLPSHLSIKNTNESETGAQRAFYKKQIVNIRQSIENGTLE